MRVLVRLHGEPLGYVGLSRGRCIPDDRHVVRMAWRRLRAEILAHLHADGETIVPCAGEDWRPPRRTPRCPNATAPGELVSVVVCTRDRGATLHRCLDCLAATTYPRVEFIIVDNAPSDDSTRRVVECYAAADPRFRYVLEPHPGLSRARNAGLAAARGTFVAYTDDDVSVDPEWIHGLVRGFARRPDVMCVSGLVCTASINNSAEAYFDARIAWYTRCTPKIFDLRRGHDHGVLYPFSAGIFGTGANFAFVRSRLAELRGFDEALGAGTRTRGGEDLDAFVRVLTLGGAIAYEPAAVAWHHHRADEPSLLRQLYGYGSGTTALMTKLIIYRPTRYRLLARIPIGIVKLTRIRTDTDNRLERGVAPPAGVLSREFAGFLAGPFLYLMARREARMSRRRSG